MSKAARGVEGTSPSLLLHPNNNPTWAGQSSTQEKSNFFQLNPKLGSFLVEYMLHRGDGDGFSEEQLQMYKDCFKLMDINKVYHP